MNEKRKLFERGNNFGKRQYRNSDESYLKQFKSVYHTMATANVNQKLVDLLTRMNSKLERIETEVKEIKDEIGLEVKPEYIEKLNNIRKEKGISFKNINELRQI